MKIHPYWSCLWEMSACGNAANTFRKRNLQCVSAEHVVYFRHISSCPRTTAKLYLKIQLYREYRFSREMSFLKRVCFRKCIQRLGTMEAIYITYPGQWSIIIIERQWNLNSIYYLKIRRKLLQNTAACATGQREWQYLSEKGHSGKHKI